MAKPQAKVRSEFRNFIGGEWIAPQSGSYIENRNPADTRELVGRFPASTSEDVAHAVDVAAEAFQKWRKVPAPRRAEILFKAGEILIKRKEACASDMTREMGKVLKEARGDVQEAIDMTYFIAGEGRRLHGFTTKAELPNKYAMCTREPIGVCGLITPWNFPMAIPSWKILPALVCGNTVVIKPAEDTPLSTYNFVSALTEAGVPAGVLNIVSGNGVEAGKSLLENEKVRLISFTGSTEVGRQLMAQASRHVLRVSMELGGNAPFVVFDDADLDAAVDGAMVAKMRNIGEACTAANRFHVHASVADAFTEKLARRMGAMKVGRGSEDGVEVGPLIDDDQRRKVAALVDDAVGRGARAIVGGEQPDGPGHFYPPTVLAGVPGDARLLREEIFGPVAPIATFATEDEAIAAANRTEYGLVAYVYTRDLDRAIRVIERLETGMVGLNQGLVSNAAAPFGGVKQSGFGREGGVEGIDEYLSIKYAAIRV